MTPVDVGCCTHTKKLYGCGVDNDFAPTQGDLEEEDFIIRF